MKTQLLPPESVSSTETPDDLYALYVQYMTDAIESLASHGGADHRRMIEADFRPIPREHFEAKMLVRVKQPARYAELVARLRRGFQAH